ncbi:MAG TPA: PqiC family protein, partial [Candidatus Methylomirabilis sp.]
RIGLVGLAATLVWLGGCLGGTSASPTYYTLTSVEAPAPDSSQAGLALGVGPVRLPAYLDRPQLVTRTGRDALNLAEFDLWAEPLKAGVPRVLGNNLAALLGTNRVTAFPWGRSHAVQYQIAVDVTRFEGAAGGDVVLGARWRILGHDGAELAAKQATITEATGAAGSDALVAAMNRALGALSRDLAAALHELPR